MRTWPRVVAVLVIAALAVLMYRWWQTTVPRAQRHVGVANDTEDFEATGRGAAATATPRDTAAEASTPRTGPKLDRAQADRMREAIHALLAEAGVLGLAGEPIDAAAPQATPTFRSMPVTGVDDAGNPKVDPKYIQARVREDLFPLALDCYSDALRRDPKLSGKLNVYFRVIGDHKVGGVVDDARLVDGTTITDPEMQTCVRESMMSVSFDAPPEDGELTVVYPIEFAPDDPDGD